MSDKVKFVTFYHGFQSIRNERYKDDVNDFVGDIEIDRLYKSYISATVDANNWEFKVAVFEEVYRLMGLDFGQWVMQQINNNTLVYDHNLEFLLDTLNFIVGHPRSLSPFTWRELLVYQPAHKTSNEIANRKIRSLKDAYPKLPSSTVDVVSLWCSRDNGFEDMLITMQLFFGSSANPTFKNGSGVSIK